MHGARRHCPAGGRRAHCSKPSGSVQYFEIAARSILNRTKPNMPFQWTINPYRGCEFGCNTATPATPTNSWRWQPADFEDKIYAKSAAAHLLRQELRRIDRQDRIAMGTATDPYQPAERRFGRTRAILEVFARETRLAPGHHHQVATW